MQILHNAKMIKIPVNLYHYNIVKRTGAGATAKGHQHIDN